MHELFATAAALYFVTSVIFMGCSAAYQLSEFRKARHFHFRPVQPGEYTGYLFVTVIVVPLVPFLRWQIVKSFPYMEKELNHASEQAFQSSLVWTKEETK